MTATSRPAEVVADELARPEVSPAFVVTRGALVVGMERALDEREAESSAMKRASRVTEDMLALMEGRKGGLEMGSGRTS